ncbi:hypothetical protein B0G93_11588 [Bacillus sp. V-88]|jgi:hypothetical protein|nr:hypothetical protein B0G93_11588 [Bacillus sp. V-88]SLK23756.1 hypothetical protein SAMN06295884_11588 [Bacillus sp. V-88]
MNKTAKKKDGNNPTPPPKPTTAEPRVVQEGFDTRSHKND